MNTNFMQRIDAAIEGLQSLAYNLWWTWNPRAQDIFRMLSERKWRSSNHNAVAVLHSLSRQELRARLSEKEFLVRIEEVLQEFDAYLTRKDTWYAAHAGGPDGSLVAYFSAEFGLHECLPIYSGGLGVLAGDHTKSASDLGVPFVGISLFYRSGYFQQMIGPDGWQRESYPLLEPKLLPVELVTDEAGNPITAAVEIGHSAVTFHAYRLRVGRAVIYLLDTNRAENDLHYREITARVYGGDSTTRIMQETILGIGGVRFLRQLGLSPSVYHMNEGHSAFLTLELLRERIGRGEPPAEAEAWVRQHCVFTTHTPVPAGHDRFTPDLLDHMLSGFRHSLGVDHETLMAYGREHRDDAQETFCMTVLALRMSRAANGVSELHGQVSREMWKDFYGVAAPAEVPIGHITNGVHILGWMANRTRQFWSKHLGAKWFYYLKKQAIWTQVSDPELIPDEELWALRYGLRRDLIEYVRRMARHEYQRTGADFNAVQDGILNPDALTIGFARRFATYKRAPLLFRDFNRIAELINNPERPVQIVFAGKAHPRDDEGKHFIQEIIGHTKNPALFGKVVFLENYDINVARHMISGVDVWLNNPRRPMEASGTSGMKILIHGGINLSIQDGWWREGYDGTNGWSIGDDANVDDYEQQDVRDAALLYDLLEQEVVPAFYDRDEFGIPRHWLQRMRRSMITLIPRFNTDRMVSEYVTRYYLDKQ
ncbi:MAG: alpha-glucan family phosphorylase [Bacteroidota bacterium]|jgi:starch phosphorylase|nr:alpha-glucan family phosphorylase [Bacteroidota bacterium]